MRLRDFSESDRGAVPEQEESACSPERKQVSERRKRARSSDSTKPLQGQLTQFWPKALRKLSQPSLSKL